MGATLKKPTLALLKKAIKYIEDRDLTDYAPVPFTGNKHVTDLSKIGVEMLSTNICKEYSPRMRTDEENYAFDDGYDAGYLAGLMEALDVKTT